MRAVILLFAVGMGLGLQAMFGQRSLDTIYVNEHQTVGLFFPSPIRQAVTGDERFVFTYDREQAGHLGLLQGVDGVDSNLLVITTDGKVYAFRLSYADSLSQMNFFLDEGANIGTEQPEKGIVADSLEGNFRAYEKVCKLLLDRVPRNLGTARSSGIRLRWEDMVYDGDEVYLLFGIQNRSEIDFEMDRLEVFQVNGSSKRRASHQEIALQPLYSCEASMLIKSGKEVRWAYVMPKFVLGKGESLKLVLEEAHGNRRVVLQK